MAENSMDLQGDLSVAPRAEYMHGCWPFALQSTSGDCTVTTTV